MPNGPGLSYLQNLNGSLDHLGRGGRREPGRWMTGARHERRATGGGKQRPHTQNTTALWYLRPTNCVHPIHVGNASGVGARGPRCFAYTLPSLAKTQHRDNMLRELSATQRHFCFLSSLGAASILMLILTKGGCGTSSRSTERLTPTAIGCVGYSLYPTGCKI